MESETTLVRAQSGIELDAISFVDLALALVVLPDNAELDDALRDSGDLESLPVLGVLLEDGRVLKGGDELWYLSMAQLK